MNSFIKVTTSLFLASSVLLSSCSTIIQGSKQNITIQSLTPDSKILVNGDEVGKDIVVMKLKRNRNHTIMVKKDGYESKTASLEKHTQAGYVVVDIVLGLTLYGLVFIIVDAATGSWNRFEKDKIVLELDVKK